MNKKEDAELWDLFARALGEGRIAVILENHPDRADTIDRGLIVTDLDDVIEHIRREE